MESYHPHERKEVPQINPETAISSDYSNQFSAFSGAIDNPELGIKFIKDYAGIFHMKKYQEVYSGYDNIVNDKNREKIKRLDELADQMNKIVKDTNPIDEKEFRKICNELNFIIYGNNDRDI